jgi:hypothetical protein
LFFTFAFLLLDSLFQRVGPCRFSPFSTAEGIFPLNSRTVLINHV